MNELDYKVMRDPETLASYRAWSRAANAKGMPLILAAIIPFAVGGLLFGKALGSGHYALDHGLSSALFSIGGGVLAVGSWRIVRHRKRVPWVAPDPVRKPWI